MQEERDTILLSQIILPIGNPGSGIIARALDMHMTGFMLKRFVLLSPCKRGARVVKLENRERGRGSNLRHYVHDHLAVLKQEPTSHPKSHI